MYGEDSAGVVGDCIMPVFLIDSPLSYLFTFQPLFPPSFLNITKMSAMDYPELDVCDVIVILAGRPTVAESLMLIRRYYGPFCNLHASWFISPSTHCKPGLFNVLDISIRKVLDKS